jgi:hypothetical protein
MSSQRLRIVTAPDGSEIPFQHQGNWSIGGLIKDSRVGWRLACQGRSGDSVLQRTAREYRRSQHAQEIATATIVDATAPMVRGYFGTHHIHIVRIFVPGSGWLGLPADAGQASIRRLARRGVTAIAFKRTGHEREADFQMDELLRDMGAGRIKMTAERCATTGHGDRPATHEISYNYRGEDERTAEHVCSYCAESYANRPVLANFAMTSLGIKWFA